MDMVPQGFSPVILQIKYTNFLVSQISFASNIRNDSNSTICAEMYSTDNEDTYCDVCKIAAKLVNRPCRVLPIFCVLTGCDKTSSIFGENKCKCWNEWKSDDWEPEITSVFTEFTIKREYMSEVVFGDVFQWSLTADHVSHSECGVSYGLCKITMSPLGLREYTK